MKYMPVIGYVHSTPAEVSAARSAVANAPNAPDKRPRGRPKGMPNKTYNRRLTPEQEARLKEIQRIKGRLTGLANKGKFQRGNPSPGEERVVFKMLRSTRDTIQRCAIRDNKTMVMFLNDFAKSLRADPRYAHLFAEGATTNNDNSNKQEEQQ